ncbi:ATP-binding protein [Acidisoma sp. 7E03]
MVERSWVSAQRLLRILFVISLFFPVALVALTFWLDYDTEWQEARGALDRQTRIASDNAARVFDAQARVAEQIAQRLAGMDAEAVRAQELALHQALLALIAPIPDVDGAIIIDRSGRALVAANIYPVPPLNLSDRAYFKATMATPSGHHIGGVMTGSLIKRRFFTFGRQWSDAEGRVLGVIQLLVSPGYFDDFYGALITGDEAWTAGQGIALLTADGTHLAGAPKAEMETAGGGLSAAARRDAFLAAVARAPSGGSYEEGEGAQAALIVYRPVPGVPLYIRARLAEPTIVAAWTHETAGHLMISMPVALLFAFLAGIALQRVQREEAAYLRLGQEMERRAAAEETLLRAQRLEAVGQVTGGVTHDFNNLLTIVLGCAELLERRPAPPENVRQLARNIRAAAERGADITASLLAFSRRRPVRAEVIDINQALLAFAPLLRRAATESRVVLFDLAPVVPRVSLDPGQFEAAILNLVGNARDALPAGGRIRIVTRAGRNDGDYPEVAAKPVTLVSVSDDGTGMDAATAARAIEPFFTTKEIGRGTGLGLSQVYGFVRQSGGSFAIDSVPGRGTTVHLVLPGCAVEVAPADARGTVGTAPFGQNERILVVEDEAPVRAIAVEVLGRCGYCTLEASNGEEAVAMLRAHPDIALLFSDIVLSGEMTGLDLVQAARALRPDLRVLMTSGYDSGPERAGNLPFLRKPYDGAALTIEVRRVLDSAPTTLQEVSTASAAV